MQNPSSSLPAPVRLAPYLMVRDAAAAIAFYQRAFGATETLRLTDPGGRVGHAELTVGGALIMIADEHLEEACVGPATLGGTSVLLALHVDDVDATLARATAAGATVRRPARDELYGERVAAIDDPFGHRWSLHCRIEALSPDEVQRRYAAAIAPTAGA